MKKEEIQLWDMKRILLGEAPLDFMLESAIRTIIIFILLIIAMRFLGKKMTANNSILELTILIVLGAIVSVPMQIPERGLLPAIVILACVVIFYRTLSFINTQNRKIEEVTTGEASLLVKNGVINVKELKKAVISHEQLFTQLRGEEIIHLGQVKRVYLEGCGLFSIFKEQNVKPGLPILPSADEKLFKNLRRSDEWFSCGKCGNTEKFQSDQEKQACTNCGDNSWMNAVVINVAREEGKPPYNRKTDNKRKKDNERT